MSNKTKPFVAKSSSSTQSQAPTVPITTAAASSSSAGDPAPAGAGNSSSVVPPRYQPPPLPPSGSSQGILKHHLIAPSKDHASSVINKQQHHHQYHSQQKLPDQVKIPYPTATTATGVDPAGNPVAAGKYYPVAAHHLPPALPQGPASGKPYPFPAYPLPGQQHHHLVTRHQQQQQQQQQPHHQQITDDRTTTQVQIHHPHHQQQQQHQQQHQQHPPQHHQVLQQHQQHQRPLLDEPGIPQIHPDLRLPLPPQHRQALRYDDEFLRPEMLKFVRKPEDTAARMPSAAAVVDPNNRHMQNILQELRSLKEANQRLADDNQELRDLCCFLDDDRQKGRKLAREWQRFGRYTASVMRQEVSAYQNKLRELDNKQQELIKDNLELKELCLYLDEERGGGGGVGNGNAICPACGIMSAQTSNGIMRDDGDGSSSSTNADEPGVPTSSSSHHQQQQQQQQQQFATTTTTTTTTLTTGTASNGVNGVGVGGTTGGGGVMMGTNSNVPRRSASRERILHENLARQRSTFNDQIMQYVRSLEQRVKQLEEDKRALTHKINQMAAAANTTTTPNDPSNKANALTNGCDPMVLSGRPEAVVRALQVLEVREQLEREGRMPPPLPSILGATERTNGNPGAAAGGENSSDSTTSQDMDDGEKALVREMCNVVWRKLEEGPPSRR